jgi:deazaflavin-dependent oxidoreductase (nitroreductase family)
MNPLMRLLFLIAATAHVALFRVTRGRRFNQIPNAGPLLLLTTTGRKSGKTRTRPVSYLPEGDDLIVIGSAGGADVHPGWAVNLRHNPDATVELPGGEKRAVKARWTKGAERDRLWSEVKTRYPVFAGYETKTERQIPLTRLSRA